MNLHDWTLIYFTGWIITFMTMIERPCGSGNLAFFGGTVLSALIALFWFLMVPARVVARSQRCNCGRG
jgi:hypothetical protein